MAVKRIQLKDFLEMAESHVVLDVRSPGEFTHAHLPGAHALPLFSDEERKVIGTAYKQQSREAAIKIGLDFFGPKMSAIVSEVETVYNNYREKNNVAFTEARTVLVHCWRGGMRSGGVAWLLDLYGFNVYTLSGGYKTFRQWVLQQFAKPYQCTILGGYTGSGKTPVLNQLSKLGMQTIDLEGLANHKGSAFGAYDTAQPSQEMFENKLAIALSFTNSEKQIWLEDESQRIGDRTIPSAFYTNMRDSPVVFLEIPFQQRLKYIVREYGQLSAQKIAEATLRIQKRLGPLETKTAIQFLEENNINACFDILLKYYDKAYSKGLVKRAKPDEQIIKLICDDVDTNANALKVSQCEVAV